MRFIATGTTIAFAMGFAFLIVAGGPPISDAGPDCIDADNDGICLSDDACSSVQDSSNLDVDADGYGNACDFDYNQDCLQNGVDFNIFLGDFLVSADSNTDCDQNGLTNGLDFNCFLSGFLGSPGPTGIASASCGS